MNSKQFLQFGGTVLVLLGILGFVGVIGPTADKSVFGDAWWFDKGENWAHLLFGIVALVAAFLFPASTQRPLVMLVGLISLSAAIYNVFTETLLGTNLESPADLILHLFVAAWALWASMKKSGSMMRPPAAPVNPV